MMMAAAWFSGCASTEKKTEIPQYKGWEKYSYGHFVYHYPEGHYWGRNVDRLATAFERYLAENCEFLAMEIPPDTIHFFMHKSWEKGRELTGRDLPFHIDNQIHWGRNTPFGLQLARYLIDRWGIRRTDFDFLYDGLASLRDYSGLDYHHQTAALLQMKKYIPLDSLCNNETYARLKQPVENTPKLGDSTAVDPMISSYCRWQAASFVAFITYNYGINRFKILWQSNTSFERAIKEIFDMDMRTFEDKWLAFAMLRYDAPENGENPLESENNIR
jgi:hypothetical protein